MLLPLRIAMYVVAGLMGLGGALLGISKGLTLVLIALMIGGTVALDIRYKRRQGSEKDA